MRDILLLALLFGSSLLFAYDESYIDSTNRPQDDFYNFANGYWIKTNVLPRGVSRYNQMSELDNLMLHKVSESLGERPDGPVGRIEETLRLYYYAGINEYANLDREREVLLEQIARIESAVSEDKIMEAIAMLHSLGVDPLFRIHDPEKWQVPEEHLLVLCQPYVNVSNGANEHYKSFLRDLFVLTGQSADEAQTSAETAIRLESEIDLLLMPQPDSPWDLYNKKSVSSVSKWFKPLDFGIWMKALSVSTDHKIVIDHPEYFQQLGSWLQKVDRPELATYMISRLLTVYCRYMHGDFKDARKVFYWNQYGLQLTDSVTEQMTRDLPEYLNEYDLHEFVTQDVNEQLASMVENIRTAWLKRIVANDWMGSSEKKRALEKITAMEFVIGGKSNPDLLIQETLSRQLTREMTFIEIAMKVRNWRTTQAIARIGSMWDANRPEWWAFSLTCHYRLDENIVEIGGGNFLLSAFDPNGDIAANYGNIGTRIAHEMTHAIDSQGRLYDANGKRLGWMSKWMLTSKFAKRSQALIDQYNHFKAFEDCAVDGSATLMENLADLGGVLTAFDAMHIELGGQAKHDAGIDRDFFITYAQSWRELITDDAQRNQCKGPHAPTRFRAYGPLQNVDRFYEVFDIQPDDPMFLEPEKRASIW